MALTDGRVVTGLPVEDTPDRLVLKTADGQRITSGRGDVEDRKTSDVSLMPEGLAQTMSDQELVDLLAFLSTLRQPVSIVGQYHVIGPVDRGRRRADARPERQGRPRRARCAARRARSLAWRRLDANAEGLVDLTAAWPAMARERGLRLHPGHLAGRAEGPAGGRHAVEPDGLARRQAGDLLRPDTSLEERAPRGRRSTCPRGPATS